MNSPGEQGRDNFNGTAISLTWVFNEALTSIAPFSAFLIVERKVCSSTDLDSVSKLILTSVPRSHSSSISTSAEAAHRFGTILLLKEAITFSTFNLNIRPSSLVGTLQLLELTSESSESKRPIAFSFKALDSL